MKKNRIYIHALFFLLLMTTFSACRRDRDEVWEDTKTAGRHVDRGFRSLGGKHGDSRAVLSREEFYPMEDGYAQSDPYAQDYVPLPDYQNSSEVAMGDYVAPQARETPGDPGSSVPGIDAFRDPASNPELARVFKPVLFEYNSTLIKDQNDLDSLRNIANYMQSRPGTYVFVEGHCDERGPEAYNLALGSKRSNAVRGLLISYGASPDRIFTISYGKERPLVMEHHEEAWTKNRRAEFKVYQR
jgi:peptidoglycan-associated lipoprotein